MTIELTVGCATYDDPHTIDTVMDWLIHHAEAMHRVEVLVADNAPDSRNGRDLKARMEKMQGLAVSVRYIESPDPLGPAATQQRLIEEAQGDAVLCLHPHVRLFPRTIAKLLDFYQANPECMDLLTGPNVLDDLRTRQSHIDDIWQSTEHGLAGEAWQRLDGTRCGVIEAAGDCAYVELAMGAKRLEGPTSRYDDRNTTLSQLGWHRLGYEDADDFEIPAPRAALFTCRKRALVGFNTNFRGFGGDRFYIAEKFRQQGRRVRCLGILPSWHLSGHLHGTPYPKSITDRVRNAMIACQELGWPSDRLRNAMVDGPKRILPPETFARIEADPIAFPYSKPRGVLTLDGPGTELLELIKRLGIKEKPGCGCRGFASTMNSWGIGGCREKREEILTVLRKNASAWGWNISASVAQQEADEAALSNETRAAIEPIEGEAEPIEAAGLLDKAKVGLLAVATGLVFKVDFSDPFPGLVDEAIRRAEAKASKAA